MRERTPEQIAESRRINEEYERIFGRTVNNYNHVSKIDKHSNEYNFNNSNTGKRVARVRGKGLLDRVVFKTSTQFVTVKNVITTGLITAVIGASIVVPMAKVFEAQERSYSNYVAYQNEPSQLRNAANNDVIFEYAANLKTYYENNSYLDMRSYDSVFSDFITAMKAVDNTTEALQFFAMGYEYNKEDGADIVEAIRSRLVTYENPDWEAFEQLSQKYYEAINRYKDACERLEKMGREFGYKPDYLIIDGQITDIITNEENQKTM